MTAGSVNLSGLVQPFRYDNIFLAESGEVTTDPSLGLHITEFTEKLLVPFFKTYSQRLGPEMIVAEAQRGFLGVDAAAVQTEVIANLTELPIELQNPLTWDLSPNNTNRKLLVSEPPAFSLDRIGTFNPDHFSIPQDSLSKASLGLYFEQKGELSYDMKGTEVKSTILYPDLRPTNYFAPQVYGVTDLASAKYIRNNERYMDAIRVKLDLKGIAESEKADMIQAIAAEIRAKGDFLVINLTESAPAKQLIFLPPLGYVSVDMLYPGTKP